MVFGWGGRSQIVFAANLSTCMHAFVNAFPHDVPASNSDA
jgi:hypothetical protein